MFNCDIRNNVIVIGIILSAVIVFCSSECPPFRYGQGSCNLTCACNQSNTQYCDSVNGACLCKRGWTSKNCTVDINECLDNNSCGGIRSSCINIPGSFQCNCSGTLVNGTFERCKGNSEELSTGAKVGIAISCIVVLIVIIVVIVCCCRKKGIKDLKDKMRCNQL